MQEGAVRLSRKEQKRVGPMENVKHGRTTLVEAAEAMGVSYRQAKRIWARYRREELSGLEHVLRGMRGNRHLPEEFRARVMEVLDAPVYVGFGPTLAAEKLEEIHGLTVSNETLRQWMMADHRWVAHEKRAGHRARRARREGFGQMVQSDGSQHAWLEDRGEVFWAMVLVDDATGRTLVHFCGEESAREALMALGKWIGQYGVPQEVYTDRRNVYGTGDPDETLTDFSRACERLGIRQIRAHSPQAKGRVERCNKTLQDRLVKELRLRGVTTREEAQTVADEWVAQYNARWNAAPASPLNFHRRKPRQGDLEEILCFEQERTVANDWTIQYEGRRYQIHRGPAIPRAGQRVTVRVLLDGRMRILHRDRALAFSAAAGANYKRVSYPPPSGGGRAGHLAPPGPAPAGARTG